MFRVVLGEYMGIIGKKQQGSWAKVLNEYLTELYHPFSRYYWGYKMSILVSSTYTSADITGVIK